MKFKIAVYGSAINDHKITDQKLKELTKELSKYKIEVITGACSGVPYQIVSELAKNKIDVTGYSPEINLEEQKKATPADDLSIYKKIVYVPKSFEGIKNSEARKKYRNVITTCLCDGAIIIAGRWGTLNEFTNLHDMGKVIGILTGTGGIADELPRLYKKISKKTNAKVIFSKSPAKLIKKMFKELEKRK